MPRIRTIAIASAVTAALPALALAQSPQPTAHPAATHSVKLGEYFFRAKHLTIHVGDTVRFTNVGKIQHTVADSTRSGTIRSHVIHPRPLSHGQSQTVTFRRAGTIYYLCTFHPTLMRGVITVTR